MARSIPPIVSFGVQATRTRSSPDNPDGLICAEAMLWQTRRPEGAPRFVVDHVVPFQRTIPSFSAPEVCAAKMLAIVPAGLLETPSGLLVSHVSPALLSVQPPMRFGRTPA